MNERLIADIDREITAKRAELAALEAARRALAGGSVAKVSPAKSGTAPTKRAPSGFLEESMTKLLKTHPGLTNGEVRDRLKKSGYAYSLSGLHVGKRLSALAEAKQLTVKLDGAKRRYYVAK